MACQPRISLTFFSVDMGTEITFSAIGLERLCQPNAHVILGWVAASEHFFDDGQNKNHEAHKCRNGISCQANKGDILVFTKGEWLSRAHIDAPEIQISVFFDDGFNIVERAHADPG